MLLVQGMGACRCEQGVGACGCANLCNLWDAMGCVVCGICEPVRCAHLQACKAVGVRAPRRCDQRRARTPCRQPPLSGLGSACSPAFPFPGPAGSCLALFPPHGAGRAAGSIPGPGRQGGRSIACLCPTPQQRAGSCGECVGQPAAQQWSDDGCPQAPVWVVHMCQGLQDTRTAPADGLGCADTFLAALPLLFHALLPIRSHGGPRPGLAPGSRLQEPRTPSLPCPPQAITRSSSSRAWWAPSWR